MLFILNLNLFCGAGPLVMEIGKCKTTEMQGLLRFPEWLDHNHLTSIALDR